MGGYMILRISDSKENSKKLIKMIQEFLLPSSFDTIKHNYQVHVPFEKPIKIPRSSLTTDRSLIEFIDSMDEQFKMTKQAQFLFANQNLISSIPEEKRVGEGIQMHREVDISAELRLKGLNFTFIWETRE